MLDVVAPLLLAEAVFEPDFELEEEGVAVTVVEPDVVPAV